MQDRDKTSDQLLEELDSLRERIAELEQANTERTELEQALRESEERFEAFSEAAFEGILIHDRGYVLDLNSRFAEMFGYEASELIGTNAIGLIAPDDRPGVTARITTLIEEPYEAHGLRKDGSTFPFETQVRHLAYRGKCVRVSVIRDTTQRERTRQASLESEQRFGNIVEASPMGIYLYQLQGDGRLVLVTSNPAAERITGVPGQSLIGKTLEEAFPSLVGTDVPEHYRRAAATREPWHSDEVVYEDSRIAGAFEVYAFQASPGRVVVMFNDITRRKQAEQERLDLEAQVQHVQKLESLGVLAGGIAHDFNNLLMGILGNADLALTELSPVSPARDCIEDIRAASARAADLCRQMLAYSGKGRFVVEPIILSDLVEEMAHMLEVSISKKALLKYSFAEDLPAVRADATQIRQVVMNLITNASEAIGDRSGVISVTTDAMECDRAYLTDTYLDEDLPAGLYATLEVSDTGCGMDDDTRSRLFEPFFTTKFTGRGLGLAAVLGIVRGHNGAIRVYSEPGRGTTFKIMLPAVEGKVLKEAEAPPAAPWQGSGCVLLADDEEAVRTVAKRMLEKVGFEVITAADGREAVELFRDRHSEIACVVLDLTMPHMDGEEAFREMRRIDPTIRVLMSSGYNKQEVTQRFVGKGLAGFIQKPYRLEELAAKVGEILGD